LALTDVEDLYRQYVGGGGVPRVEMTGRRADVVRGRQQDYDGHVTAQLQHLTDVQSMFPPLARAHLCVYIG